MLPPFVSRLLFASQTRTLKINTDLNGIEQKVCYIGQIKSLQIGLFQKKQSCTKIKITKLA